MLKYVLPSLAVLALAGVTAGMVGCADQSGPATADPTMVRDHDHSDHAGHGHATPAANGAHADALAELSPEDRALAERQKACPVSGVALGSMGAPYKTTIQGRDLMLCCPPCEGRVKEDPDKYLAKLPQG